MFQEMLAMSKGGSGGITIEKGLEVSYPTAYNTFVDTGLKADDGLYFTSFSVNSSYNSLYQLENGNITPIPTSANSFQISILSNGNIGIKHTYNYADWNNAVLYCYKIS